jgi:hypothetical protein
MRKQGTSLSSKVLLRSKKINERKDSKFEHASSPKLLSNAWAPEI